jgi:hypothetical protein
MRRKECLLIFAVFLIMAMFSPYVSATFDWKQYGNGIAWLTQNQYGFTFTGSFPNNVYSLTTAQGVVNEANVQPLVFSFNQSLLQGELQQYILFQQGLFFQIYDKNLNLVQEIQTDNPVSYQVGLVDFNNSGYGLTDVAGIYNTSATNFLFNVYHFNPTLSTFSNAYQYNISVTAGTQSTGMRCSGNACFFLLSNPSTNSTFYYINSSTIISQQIIDNPLAPYLEPLGYSDMNGDGKTEYWTYSSSISKSQVIIFQADGTIKLKKSYFTTGSLVLDMKVYSSDASSLWKTAIFNSVLSTTNSLIDVYKTDGSLYWTASIPSGIAGSYNFPSTRVGSMSVADFDGDTYADIYYNFASYVSASATKLTYGILKGNTGADLYSQSPAVINNPISAGKLTTADMNGDGKFDFIAKITHSPYTYLDVVSPLNSTTRLYNSSVSSGSSCVPADVDYNGKLDIVCSGASRTTIFYSNYTNQAPTISTITYSPSTSIAIGSVTAIITANDVEGDNILYSHNCFNGDSWSSQDSNPAQVCTYGAVGIYNMSVGVNDGFHSPQANTFSQAIIVTATGGVCGNAICEAGETSQNCLVDCPISSQQNYTTTATGGMPIPTKIVDVNNLDAGLLPEIYYGILAFFSNSLLPMIIIVFTIFIALIILTIATIVKKVARKVGE